MSVILTRVEQVDPLVALCREILLVKSLRRFVLQLVDLVLSSKSLLMSWDQLLLRLHNGTELDESPELGRDLGLVNAFHGVVCHVLHLKVLEL